MQCLARAQAAQSTLLRTALWKGIGPIARRQARNWGLLPVFQDAIRVLLSRLLDSRSPTAEGAVETQGVLRILNLFLLGGCALVPKGQTLILSCLLRVAAFWREFIHDGDNGSSAFGEVYKSCLESACFAIHLEERLDGGRGRETLQVISTAQGISQVIKSVALDVKVRLQ
eukprot:scaffold2724_cov260-Pinguiococcus_pyrenoidosus.AAC.5